MIPKEERIQSWIIRIWFILLVLFCTATSGRCEELTYTCKQAEVPKFVSPYWELTDNGKKLPDHFQDVDACLKALKKRLHSAQKSANKPRKARK